MTGGFVARETRAHQHRRHGTPHDSSSPRPRQRLRRTTLLAAARSHSLARCRPQARCGSCHAQAQCRALLSLADACICNLSETANGWSTAGQRQLDMCVNDWYREPAICPHDWHLASCQLLCCRAHQSRRPGCRCVPNGQMQGTRVRMCKN